VAYIIFRIAFASVFIGLHAALMAGLILEWRRGLRPAPEAGEAPLVSVIIPFRNEEKYTGVLLEGLRAQEYPKIEFILIDDRSGDGTAELLRSFASRQKNARIITLKDNPGPNHKQYALQKGLEAATGEIFLFTDADCTVPPGWAGAMILRMADKRVGAAIGPVFKQARDKAGFFVLYQCFDHAVRYMYLAASTGLGAAGGGFGNNLILRREALDAIGGYGAVPPSPTEDAALISRIRAKTNYRIRSILGRDTVVLTGLERTWKSFAGQTLRWNNGGLFSPDASTRLNFAFLMITISMGMLALPVLPFVPSLWPLPAAVFLSMSANTIAVLACFGPSLPKAGLAYIVLTPFTPLYFTLLTILGLLGFRSNWKEQPKPRS
jgi:cellulose synthase/poly-beta-1,6-N-acetylglucosamine synthase-like glycosyltransferase